MDKGVKKTPLEWLEWLHDVIVGLEERDKLVAEREAAAAELRISLREHPIGSIVSTLVSANALLRQENSNLLSRAVDAEQERDELRARLLDKQGGAE